LEKACPGSRRAQNRPWTLGLGVAQKVTDNFLNAGRVHQARRNVHSLRSISCIRPDRILLLHQLIIDPERYQELYRSHIDTCP
jgi:uncharacterized protein HemY